MKKAIFSIVLGLGMLSHANAFAGDSQAGKAKAATCAGCHGANGIGIMGTYPNLAGQHADYIAKQLKAFKAGDRKDPVMAPMAMALSEQDMADIGAYYASFTPSGKAKAGATASTPATGEASTPAAAPVTQAPTAYVSNSANGKSLYELGDASRGIAACIGCHGDEGNSTVLIYPNLAKQHPEYVAKQLKAFKDKTRDNNFAMTEFAGQLTENEIADVAAYLADTKAVANVKAKQTVATAPISNAAIAGKTKAAACAACHGADGNALIPMYPSLAGQSAAYLAKQITDFKTSARKDPVMAPMVAALSDEDIKDISAYFAAQTAKPATAESNAEGRKLYFGGDSANGITACIACHGVKGGGMDNAAFPAVAGQSVSYLESQLKKFRDGSRSNDKNRIMGDIAIKLSDKDIKNVAQFMASLK